MLTRYRLDMAYAAGQRGFSGEDFRASHPHRANLRHASLQKTDFRGTDLRGADLRGADLTSADLRGASLRGAMIAAACLMDADFTGADLSLADFENAGFRRTRLHASGTWSEPPPRCSAGDIHAVIVAPGIVRLGNVDRPVGKLIKTLQAATYDGRAMRTWLMMANIQTEWPGWASIRREK